MEGVKIYGLCLERLKHQITKAKERTGKNVAVEDGPLLLESYNTAELEDIIDILELYDIENRTFSEVTEKLKDLAYTVSELVREAISFGYTAEGHLGLYLSLPKEAAMSVCEAAVAGYPA